MKTILAITLVLGLNQAFAQSELTKKLPMDPNVKMGTLPNGLKYYIQKNEEPKKRAQLRLVVKAGSILENENQQGLAHFVEHMNFNGTKNFPKNELVNFLQKSGVKFGADLNAYTGFDETVYMLPVPTDTVEILIKGLQILEDWAHNATFDNAEIDKERGVVLEESRSGKGANQRLRDKYFPLVLNNSQYAKRLPIGKDTILKTFSYNTVKQFHKDWYRPDLQAVMVVGDVDVAMVEKQIIEKFGRIPKAIKPKPRTKYKIGLNGSNEFAIVTDKEQPYTIIQSLNKQNKKVDITYQDRRDGLARNLFNQMLSARIQELTQSATPPFLYGNAGHGGFLGELDAFSTIAVAKGNDVETALKAVLDEIAKAKQFGFTETELERTKKAYLVAQENSFKEKDKTNSEQLVGGLVNAFLKDEPVTSIAFGYEFTKKYLDQIKLTELNSLAKTIITEGNNAIILMGPEKEKDNLPTVAKLKEIIASAGKNIKAYEDKTINKPLLANIPTGSKVTNTKTIPEIGVTELTFGNGVKAVIKSTDFKNDEILIGGESFGGENLYNEADVQNAKFASAVTELSGLGEFSTINLQKLMAGKNASIGTYTTNTGEGIYGSSSPQDFETALQLLYSQFTQPRLDTDVVKGFFSNQKEALANMEKTPTPDKVYYDTLGAVMSSYSSRMKPLTAAGIDKIDINKAFEIYKERFADASDFTFFFVGNLKVAEATPLLEKYLGGLPAAGKKENYKDLGIYPPKGKVEKVVYKGTEPKAKITMVWTGDFTSTPENETQLEALTEILEIKLTEKLREEESGVYGVQVKSRANKIPAQKFSFTIGFGCAPENLEKLVNKTLAEIEKLKTSGAELVDVEKFKAETKRQTELQLRDNNFWKSYLQNQYKNGEDLKDVLKEDEFLKLISSVSVKNSANTYFADNLIKIILLPEKK